MYTYANIHIHALTVELARDCEAGALAEEIFAVVYFSTWQQLWCCWWQCSNSKHLTGTLTV